MITVAKAPNKARKLIKRTAFLRREITRASKAEEAGTKGAAEERQRLTADFQRDFEAVETAIEQTTATATDLEMASMVLRTGDTAPQRSPVAQLCAMACRLGVNGASLVDLLDHAAQRGRDAAEKAQDRLADNDDELNSVGLLALFTAKLPAVGFDTRHPSVSGIRKQYLDRSQIAASKRRKQ
ncbi:hypothetical protein [Falsiruegeria mediterranea]